MVATPPYMNSSSIEWTGAYIKVITAVDTAYLMRAVAGSTTDTAVWQIQRLKDDGATYQRITYADGSPDFKFIATSYASYTYL